MKVDARIYIRKTTWISGWRENAVGVVVDVIATPGLFGISFVYGPCAHEKMGIAVAGLRTQEEFEKIDIAFIFH